MADFCVLNNYSIDVFLCFSLLCGWIHIICERIHIMYTYYI